MAPKFLGRRQRRAVIRHILKLRLRSRTFPPCGTSEPRRYIEPHAAIIIATHVIDTGRAIEKCMLPPFLPLKVTDAAEHRQEEESIIIKIMGATVMVISPSRFFAPQPTFRLISERGEMLLFSRI